MFHASRMLIDNIRMRGFHFTKVSGGLSWVDVILIVVDLLKDGGGVII